MMAEKDLITFYKPKMLSGQFYRLHCCNVAVNVESNGCIEINFAVHLRSIYNGRSF